MNYYKLSISIVFWFHCCIIVGQVNDPRFSGRPTDIKEPADTLVTRPSLEYNYVLSGDLDVLKTFSDTTLGNGFMFVDPTRKSGDEYIHLGYLGTASYPLSYRPSINKGFNMGIDPYQIYNQNVDSIRFYKANRTVADLSFYQISGNQDNFNSNADYSQAFKDGIRLNVNFHRYNFDGLYSNADNQSTSFAIGLDLDNDRLPFKSYLLFLSNINNESHNGGVVDYNFVENNINVFRSNVAVALNNNQSRNTSKLIKWHLTRNLFKDNVAATYDLTYNWEEYFYYDQTVSTTSDSSVYKSYIKDPRGIRFNFKNKRVSNELGLDLLLFKKFDVNLRLVHDLYFMNDGQSQEIRNDLSIMYKGRLDLKNKFGLNIDGHLGIGANAGNFGLNATSQFRLKDWLFLKLKWSNYLTEPSYISENLTLNTFEVYRNKFNKMLGTIISGQLSIPVLGLSVKGEQNVVNNAIFWNQEALPEQFGGVFSSTKLSTTLNWKFWRFGLENSGTYQYFSTNLYHMPEWYTTHNVYFESNLFKNNLLLRLGTTARLIPAGNSLSFMPVNGQFYQSGYNTLLYPEWGWYISGKVSRFRILVEYDNLTFWYTDKVNYNVVGYPNLDGNLRFGVRWLLLD